MSLAAKSIASTSKAATSRHADFCGQMIDRIVFQAAPREAAVSGHRRALPIFTEDSALQCPSAHPEMSGAMILGVVLGSTSEPHAALLSKPLPVDPALLSFAGGSPPTSVFRFAAPCAENECRHFNGAQCRLAEKIVAELPEVVAGLPSCRIRPSCRWWQQEGRAACVRCPQIVTYRENPGDELRAAADPDR
jgi:hypothetical protein